MYTDRTKHGESQVENACCRQFFYTNIVKMTAQRGL